MNHAGSLMTEHGWTVAALIFVTIRVIWFFEKYRSWEFLFALIILNAVLITNLSTFNAFLRIDFDLSLIFLILTVICSFEPELVRIFHLLTRRKHNRPLTDRELTTIIEACKILAETKTGALISIQLQMDLNQFGTTGTPINADLTKELLVTLFTKNAPTHDGGVIIHRGKISRSGVIFPLTRDLHFNLMLGTRHRAGVGLTESSDAICLIVSEQAGTISAAKDGELFHNLDPESLKKKIRYWLRRNAWEPTRSFHILRTFRYHSTFAGKMRFARSLSSTLYDTQALALITLLVFYELGMHQKPLTHTDFIQFVQSGLAFYDPWNLLPCMLILWLGFRLSLGYKMVIDKVKNEIFRRLTFLYVPIYWKHWPVPNMKQVVVKKAMPSTPLWRCWVENQKGKKFAIDSGGGKKKLFRDAQAIAAFLEIELINRS